MPKRINKGIQRFIFFIVFLIPITWYLFLQAFGENKFSLKVIKPIPSSCGVYQDTKILMQSHDLGIESQNYLDRVIFGAKKRKVSLDTMSNDFFNCLETEQNFFALVDEKGLRGIYSLDREGVDLLLTELDVLLLQKMYGKGTNR